MALLNAARRARAPSPARSRRCARELSRRDVEQEEEEEEEEEETEEYLLAEPLEAQATARADHLHGSRLSSPAALRRATVCTSRRSKRRSLTCELESQQFKEATERLTQDKTARIAPGPWALREKIAGHRSCPTVAILPQARAPRTRPSTCRSR